jgi:hypothetical protein
MAWQVQFSVLKVGFLPEKLLKFWESEKLRWKLKSLGSYDLVL